MGAEKITADGLILLMALFVPIIMINKTIGLRLSKSLIISIIRMGLQLSLVSVYLVALFDYNKWWLNTLYICILLVISGFTITKSCNLRRSKFVFLIFVGIGIPLILIIIFFNGVVIHLNNIFDARYIVTIGGMLLGNCIKSLIISINSFYNDIKDSENTYLLYLSLGASRGEALKPKMVNAMELGLKPVIASVAVTGLVALPGMMTGQILGGAVPIDAVVYQFAIMLAIFIVQYFAIAIVLKMVVNISFDKRDRLREDLFTVSG